ncbi:MAG: preprotein translocase subunit SecY [Clostridia bacterium]|jgi:preprotein translocase subunit SecY|nr:preprotein translocase subunit SecY [Clostridia bacterium]
MFKTIRDAWNVPDLRKKILFTLFIIVLYRLGSVIPVPFASPEILQQATAYAGNSLLTYFTFIAGESFSQATLFALSISPYITASIVVQLLCVAIPKWQEWQKEDGEEGRRKLDKITRYITVGLSLITAFGYYQYLKANNAIINVTLFSNATLNQWAIAIVMIACYCAGACLIMWLGEKIDNFGIGNGISIILFINILSGIPRMVQTFYVRNLHPESYGLTDAKAMPIWLFIIVAVLIVIFFLAAITFIVHMTEAERRIKVSYAKRVQGRKMYGGQDSDLPIKLNMSGVMPIIFAQSIASIPSTIALIAPGTKPAGFDEGTYAIANFKEWWYVFTNKTFSYTSPLYMVIFFALIIAFAYFYITISFDPTEISNNLKKNGGFVLGLRPGAPTANFIKRVTNRITLIGALFLGVVAIIPLIVNATMGNSLGIVAFGGTSILILVGVALETVRELEAQLTTYRRPGTSGGIFRGKRK